MALQTEEFTEKHGGRGPMGGNEGQEVSHSHSRLPLPTPPRPFLSHLSPWTDLAPVRGPCRVQSGWAGWRGSAVQTHLLASTFVGLVLSSMMIINHPLG